MKCTTFGRVLVLTASTAFLHGCGGDGTTQARSSIGEGHYHGQPVTKGVVSFVPTGGPGADTGQTATGEIGTDGSYSLTTFDSGDGAVLGEHTVLVNSREEDVAIQGHGMPIPDAQGKLKINAAKSLVPDTYSTVGKSPLRYTVKEGSKTNNIELKDSTRPPTGPGFQRGESMARAERASCVPGIARQCRPVPRGGELALAQEFAESAEPDADAGVEWTVGRWAQRFDMRDDRTLQLGRPRDVAVGLVAASHPAEIRSACTTTR